jgi:hypothetical protein
MYGSPNCYKRFEYEKNVCAVAVLKDLNDDENIVGRNG